MTFAFVRRHAVSIGVLVIALVLGGYLYWLDKGRVTSSEAEARKRNLLRAFRRADITELVVENEGKTLRIAKRSDDAGDALYYLNGGELADQSAVDKMLGVLEFATAERRIEESAIDRHAIGLDAPRARVTVTMGTLKYRLSIGGPAASPPGAAYAEVAGEGMAVVSRDLVAELTRPHDAYRSKTLVPYLSSSLSELGLDGAGGARRFVIGPWGGWGVVLEGGQRARVDRDLFDRLLSSLADVRAEAFTTEPDATVALAAARDKIRLTMIPRDAGPRAVLDIGGACPGHDENVVALRSAPAPMKAACVPKGVMDPLSTPLARLADLHLFSLRPDEIEEIALAGDGQRLELARSGAGWHLRAPSEGRVENDVGHDFARTLHDLVGERIVTNEKPESLGFAAPRATAKIVKAGGGDEAPVETVELGATSTEGRAYVRRIVDGAILEVARDAADVLIPNGFALRSRKVIDHPLGQVTRVVVEGPSIRQVLRRSPTDAWTLEEPKLAVDPGLAGDVAAALAELRADRWIADRDDGSFGLGSPRAKFQLELDEGIVRVEVGHVTSGGAFARRTDEEGVFVLPGATERKLETWAVDRSYFMFDPNEITEIRIDRPGKRLLLTPPRSGAREATSRAEQFEIARRALSETRAEGVVHLGAARKEEGFDRPLMTLTVQRAGTPIRISIGRGDAFRDVNVFFARREGIDATFAIADNKLRPLFDLE